MTKLKNTTFNIFFKNTKIAYQKSIKIMIILFLYNSISIMFEKLESNSCTLMAKLIKFKKLYIRV